MIRTVFYFNQTDSEASEYNRNGTKLAGRKQGRHYRQNIAVDVSQLTTEEARIHERTLMRQAMMIVAIRSAQHTQLPAIAGPARVTPRMIEAADGTGSDVTRAERNRAEPETKQSEEN